MYNPGDYVLYFRRRSGWSLAVVHGQIYDHVVHLVFVDGPMLYDSEYIFATKTKGFWISDVKRITPASPLDVLKYRMTQLSPPAPAESCPVSR